MRRRIDVGFLLILSSALLLRLHLATTAPYIHDEENTSIPLSQSISFEPGYLNLPLRAENHGALPAYFVKASSTLFGTTPLGYRTVHVLAGLCTIVLVYLLASDWFGRVAARWAAALVAFNEYYLAISSRATAQAPTLLFDAGAIYAFSRFLRTQRPGYLYAAGASVGLAFYCKENSALLLPVFFLTLLHPKHRPWLRSPHVYLACATFFLTVAPDVVWNLTTNRETVRATYGKEDVNYATYSSHLQRIGGLGLSAYPAMFYARSAVMPLYLRVTGTELSDETPEYRSMNPAIGVLLLGGVLLTAFRPAHRNDLQRFLLVLFGFVFGFFTLIRPGSPPGRLDPVSWIWVEVTMLAAVVLTGSQLAAATGKSRVASWAFAAAALVYAVWNVNGS